MRKPPDTVQDAARVSYLSPCLDPGRFAGTEACSPAVFPPALDGRDGWAGEAGGGRRSVNPGLEPVSDDCSLGHGWEMRAPPARNRASAWAVGHGTVIDTCRGAAGRWPGLAVMLPPSRQGDRQHDLADGVETPASC
ncbi:hypothetical protein CDD83_6894 [Cordyceps sp. RAO-2017]|nr:hypothetical protein CDD83_6894 [Cordyceps sp. RAO-2017]